MSAARHWSGVVMGAEAATAPPSSTAVRGRRAVLPVVLALVGGASALALVVWLPSHLTGEHQLGSELQPGEVTWWMVSGVLLAQSVLVVVVARSPTGGLVLVTGLPLVILLAPAPPLGLYTLSAIAEMTGVLLAASTTPLGRLRIALLGAASLVAAGQLLNGLRSGTLFTASAVGAAVGQAVVVIGLPLLLGALVAARRAAEESHRRQLAALHGEQEALLAAASSRQCIAMSRELHDIAAHHLSGIALLAAAIVHQVDYDPGAAKASAGQVREQSRAVLSDLRRLVGLLREDGEAPRPVETIAALAALVQDRCAAGAAIELTVTGPVARRAADIGPLGQLVVHRMVQESLSNAAAHAPGARCTVDVAAEGEGLLVLVRNEAVDAPRAEAGGDEHRSGFGLRGMAERAQLVGGRLTYGPGEVGGWQVRLVVPIEGASSGARRSVSSSPA